MSNLPRISLHTLSRPSRGLTRELQGADINYACTAAELDAKVDELVQGLLRRSAYALAWTKRAANRHVITQLNQTLDAAAAYEMVNFLQIERQNGVDPKSLH